MQLVTAYGFDSRRIVALRSALPLVSADAPTQWVHVAHEGEWLGHRGGEFTFDAEVFAQVRANFEAQANPVKLDFDHETLFSDGPTPARGWVHGLELREDGGSLQLWALVEFGPDAVAINRKGGYRYCSGVFDFDATDRVTGEPCGCVMSSLALTDDPFIDGQEPIRLSRRERCQEESMKKAQIVALMAISKESLVAALDQIEGDEITPEQLEAAAAFAAAKDGTLEEEEPPEASMASLAAGSAESACVAACETCATACAACAKECRAAGCETCAAACEACAKACAACANAPTPEAMAACVAACEVCAKECAACVKECPACEACIAACEACIKACKAAGAAPMSLADPLPGDGPHHSPDADAALAVCAPLMEATGLDMAGLAAAITENLDAVVAALKGALNAPAAEAPLSDLHLSLRTTQTALSAVVKERDALAGKLAKIQEDEADAAVETYVSAGVVLDNARDDMRKLYLSDRGAFGRIVASLRPVVTVGEQTAKEPTRDPAVIAASDEKDPEIVGLRRMLSRAGVPAAAQDKAVRERLASRRVAAI